MRYYLIFLIAIFLSACHTKQLAVVKVGNKFGCINRKGNIIIQPAWDYIFIDELTKPILVEQDSLYGFVNKRGKVLIKPQYKDADLYSEGLASVSDGKKYGYINLKGDTIIKFQFEQNA